MLPFRKILCPTDFSEASREAMKVAREFASHFNSELCLVHIVSPVPIVPFPEGIPPTFDVRSYQQELEVSSRKALEEVVRQLESNQVRSRLIMLQGDPARQIMDLADEEKPDLLVLATHGKSGWERLIFGSVAEKVIRLAPCPVLLIPRPQEKEKEAAQEPKESVPSEPETAPSDISSLIQKPKEIILEKKRAYQEKIEAQLKEWAAKTDALKTRADKTKTDAQVIYKEQIENLRTKQEAARQKLQELKDSGEEAWGELKVGLDKALEDFKKAFSSARSKFKQK
jgi:universal stress protein A